MKRRILPIILLVCLTFSVLCACNKEESTRFVPESFASAQEVVEFLLEGNRFYTDNGKNSGNIGAEQREDTAENGQKPYATVITCSDSRVPAEHIFSAGIGELFVIRTAGNVIDDFSLGSVEYGAEHLGTQLVLVLGHTNCGAVGAALNGGAHGNIEKITDEIKEGIAGETDPKKAEELNVRNSIGRISSSEIIRQLIEEGNVTVRGAIYDIETGKVELLEP